jgi:hypothetical protein
MSTEIHRELINLWADALLTTKRPQIQGEFFDYDGGACAVGILRYVCLGKAMGLPADDVPVDAAANGHAIFFPLLGTIPAELLDDAMDRNDSEGQSFQTIGRWLKANLPPEDVVVIEDEASVDLVTV